MVGNVDSGLLGLFISKVFSWVSFTVEELASSGRAGLSALGTPRPKHQSMKNTKNNKILSV